MPPTCAGTPTRPTAISRTAIPIRSIRPHATYYIAYIDYSRGDLQAAKREFASIADNPAYEPIIPFYLLQIEFREKNYDYVVANGIPLLAKATEARQQEISRIVSEPSPPGRLSEGAGLYGQLRQIGR